MLKIQIDPNLHQYAEKLRQWDGILREDVWQKTREVSLQMEKDVKEATPVDTGRAKASWGHFTPRDLRRAKRISKSYKTKSGALSKRARWVVHGTKTGEQIARVSEAIWIEEKANLSITQGTLVPYMAYLNDGTSKMAGLGHVDRAFERACLEFEKYSAAVEKMLDWLAK